MSVYPSIRRPLARRLAVAAILAVGAFPLSVGVARAHAFLARAAPAVGSTVAAAPTEVVLDFTEAVEPRFCRVEVLDAQGQHVDAGDLHPAPGDARRLVIALKSLAPGTFTVKWRVVAADTHHTEGSFVFQVRP